MVGFVVNIGESLHLVRSLSAFRSVILSNMFTVKFASFGLASLLVVLPNFLPALSNDLLDQSELLRQYGCLLLQLKCLFIACSS